MLIFIPTCLGAGYGYDSAFSKDGSVLYVLSSARDTKVGKVHVYDISNNKIIRSRTHSEPILLSTYSWDTMFMTTARFEDSKKYDLAIGNPNANDHKGIIYRLRGNDLNLRTEEIIIGKRAGERFGYCILAVDLNNRRNDHLFVGAPAFSSQKTSMGLSGRVYVFKKDASKYLLINTLRGSDSPGAFFGSTMANLGDINKDGVNDVVIGAPFEDKTGVIYVYYGISDNGVSNKYQV